MYFLPYYCFVLGLKISAIRYPKNIAAVIPPAAPFIPPVKAPINPSSFTAFIAESAKPFPKLGRGIEAPAPAAACPCCPAEPCRSCRCPPSTPACHAPA